MNKDRLNTVVMSAMDVIEAYVRYDASEEAKEPILYFISELTSISVDAVLEAADNVK